MFIAALSLTAAATAEPWGWGDLDFLKTCEVEQFRAFVAPLSLMVKLSFVMTLFYFCLQMALQLRYSDDLIEQLANMHPHCMVAFRWRDSALSTR
jgi:hypothetical protein